ncbi:MAG: hypothetical protein AAB513_01175 [Patescibacteria group bacterium]
MNDEDEKIIWDRKLFWKIIKWTGIILVILFLLLMEIGYYGPKFQQYLIKKSQENYIAKVKAEDKRLEELQKNDTYGGKTPEETLDLYIEALKKGDVGLASKYYRVDQQEEVLRDLAEVKTKNNLEFPIDFATEVKNRGNKTCVEDNCYIVYEYVNPKEEILSIEGSQDTITIPKGNLRKRSINLEFNKFPNIWKIVEP